MSPDRGSLLKNLVEAAASPFLFLNSFPFFFLPCHFVAVDTNFANTKPLLEMHYSRADRPTSESPSQKVCFTFIQFANTFIQINS